VQSRRTGVDGHGVWGTLEASELSLELGNLGAGTDPTAS